MDCCRFLRLLGEKCNWYVRMYGRGGRGAAGDVVMLIAAVLLSLQWVFAVAVAVCGLGSWALGGIAAAVVVVVVSVVCFLDDGTACLLLFAVFCLNTSLSELL